MKSRVSTLIRRIRPAWARYLVVGILAALALVAVFVGSVFLGAWGRLPSLETLRTYQPPQASEVYTSDSVLIGKFYLDDRQAIPLAQVPMHARDALIAIEDERFYDHSGIDFRSLLRVLVKTVLLQQSSAGGGSTLTQQLAKNMYPRSRHRGLGLAAEKVKEMVTARKLEHLYPKDTLLQRYLNTVPFGGNTFGLESASRKFFNKPAAGLRPEEAATLIGMLKATHSYNPHLFPERSRERRNVVLRAMAENGYLTHRQADSLQGQPLELDYQAYRHDSGMAPYFREAVRKDMVRWLEERQGATPPLNLYTSGLKIYTTLHSGMQQLAETTMQVHMARLQQDFEAAYGKRPPWKNDPAFIRATLKNSPAYRDLQAKGLGEDAILDSLKKPRDLVLKDWAGRHEVVGSTADSLLHYAKFLNTGVLAIEAQSGAVRCWVGGIDFETFKYDHVSQSKRQVGSVFKPIVYTAALEKGIPPCRYFPAQAVRYDNLEDWTPSNAPGRDETYLNYSMEEALRNSVNTVAVKVMEATGVDAVVSQARALGIQSDLPRLPSLALGTASLGLPEVAGAYAAYVNQGRPVRPYWIERVTDARDSLLFQAKPEGAGSPAFSGKSGAIMLEMLKSVVESGTASRIREVYGLKGAIGGKTGTTQNNKDAWFVGLTPRLVHVSWVGLDDHRIGFPNTRLGQGANAALPLFALWYRDLCKDPRYRAWTGPGFNPTPEEILEAMACDPVRRDGFLKRLFKNPRKTKTRKYRDHSLLP